MTTALSDAGVMFADGSVQPNAAAPQINAFGATLAANALTITQGAISLAFRSATLSSGAVAYITGTPANLVIPSTATLGTISAVQSRLVVLLLKNAGVLELAVVNSAGGNDLSETGVISTTAISAASNSANVIYSTTARTGVAYRVVGYVQSTQATAGTWATAPSTIQGVGGQASQVIRAATEAYILIRDEKISGTAGGTATAGAWRTRDLNTKTVDTGSNATLASNQITLAAGTYRFSASAPSYLVSFHQSRLQNITAGTTVAAGTSELSAASDNIVTRSFCQGRFTIAVPSVFELQHQFQTSRAPEGLGYPAGFGTEVYSVIEFWKEF